MNQLRFLWSEFRPTLGEHLRKLPIIVAVFLIALIGLLFAANLVSVERMQKHFQSVDTLGDFTTCEVALSLVVQQDATLRAALAPTSIDYSHNSSPCTTLHEFYAGDSSEAAYFPLRQRYIWGFRVVHAAFASILSDQSIRTLLSALVYLTGLLLLWGLSQLGSNALIFSMPIVVGGLLFAGVTSISGLPLAVSFLWAWVVPLILLVKDSRQFQETLLFLAGMQSAFLWFLDGHIILIVTLCSLVTYFQYVESRGARTAITRIIINLFYFHAGLIFCFVFFLVLKGFVLGWGATFDSFIVGILHNASTIDNSREDISFIAMVHKLIFVGFQYTSTYQHVFLWKFLIVSSAACVFLSGILLTLNSQLRKKLWPYVIVLVIIVTYVIIRILILPHHSFIHARLMSRYLIIPIAASWSLLLIIVKHSLDRRDTGVERQS